MSVDSLSFTDSVDDFVMVNHNDDLIPTTHYLNYISTRIESLSQDLREISLSIHDNPELQYKEFHAHKVLTEYLSRQTGWEVTSSAYGIETAFVAVYDTGRKNVVVSFNAEYGKLTLKSSPHSLRLILRI